MKPLRSHHLLGPNKTSNSLEFGNRNRDESNADEDYYSPNEDDEATIWDEHGI